MLQDPALQNVAALSKRSPLSSELTSESKRGTPPNNAAVADADGAEADADADGDAEVDADAEAEGELDADAEADVDADAEAELFDAVDAAEASSSGLGASTWLKKEDQ